MPRIGKGMGDDSPKGPPTADDVYSLSTTRDDEEGNFIPDEATGLLAGTRTSYSDASGEDASPPRKDSWAGHEEFEGLPWYKTPNVCRSSLLAPPGTCRALVLY